MRITCSDLATKEAPRAPQRGSAASFGEGSGISNLSSRLTCSYLTTGDHERLDGNEVSPQPCRSQLSEICEQKLVSGGHRRRHSKTHIGE